MLRVVDERVFEQVGSNKSIRCHARLIVATNRSLEAEVEAGRFRSDLYYRLNVASFQLPSLRERPAAIASIAEAFFEEFAARAKLPPPHLSFEAMELMQSYRWPGNVRELRNAMERAVALCVDEIIYAEDLPESIATPANAASEWRLDGSHRDNVRSAAEPPQPETASTSASEEPVTSAIRDLHPSLSELAAARLKGEMQRVLEALDRCNNNRSRAAEELGISRTALYKKLHKLGMLD